MWDDIEHQKNVITALKKIIGYDQMEGVAPSPAVSEVSLHPGVRAWGGGGGGGGGGIKYSTL